jgi:Immunity protein 27
MENEMGIAPDELEIRGSWLMVNGRMTEDVQCRRISVLTKTELQHVATSKDGWEKLYRDPRDGRCWELTYPQSEMEGGGPPALILTNIERAHEKYGVPVEQ